jgi:hypothetical protein
MALAGSDSRWFCHLVEEWLVTVHNHGTEEGKGLSCREIMVDGKLRGECMDQSDSSDPVGQSADLRTRIAAVIHKHNVSEYDTYLGMADVVIEALNLDVAVTYLSADKLRREVCVEGYYTVEVNDD